MKIEIKNWYKSLDGMDKARVEKIEKNIVTFKFVERREDDTYGIGDDTLTKKEFAKVFPHHMAYEVSTKES
jgi:hypothetical protein